MLRLGFIDYGGRLAPDSGGMAGGRGGSDGNDERHERLKASARAIMADELAKSESLTPLRRKQYRQAADDVIERMPPRALELWHENFHGIRFYPTAEEVNEMAVAIKRQSGQEVDQKDFIAAFVDDAGKAHLNGGSDLGDKTLRMIRHYYAHEFGHIVDHGNKFSNKPEWQSAWSAEGGEFKEALARERFEGPQEGFAHAAMLAWLYRPYAERHFPKCLNFLVQAGLA